MRALEERGIGRPSTYASIMGTILDRGYVRKEGQALVPSFLAFAVTNLLEQHFGAARRLRVHRADGGRPRPDRRRRRGARRLAAAVLLRRRRRRPGLKELVTDLDDIDARAINTIAIGDGHRAARRPLRPVPRARRRARDRRRRPRARRADRREGGGAPRRRAVERARARRRPETGRDDRRQERPLRARTSPSRRTTARSRAPRRSSSRCRRRRSRSSEALPLLALPRMLGADRRRRGGRRRERPLRPVHQEGQGDALARDRRSSCFTITLEEALALLAQPKQRRRPRRGRAPLQRARRRSRSAGSRSCVKDGRFGPYVTDGETNASLRARRLRRRAHARAGGRAAGRAAGEGAARKRAGKPAV